MYGFLTCFANLFFNLFCKRKHEKKLTSKVACFSLIAERVLPTSPKRAQIYNDFDQHRMKKMGTL